VTTLTTRKKKTSKKKKVSKKTTTSRKTKKPKWGVISFKEIEEWREKLGLTKSGMALALEVTNSTYHNWRRGTTVPHASQQDDIFARVKVLRANASGKNKQTPGGGKPKPKAKAKTRAKTGARAKTSAKRGRGPIKSQAPSQPAQMGVASPDSHPRSTSVPRPDIAAIAVAFVESQKKPVSAGSIVDLVNQLRTVM
jgi:DNA-binding transcriptional regulator YiaG